MVIDTTAKGFEQMNAGETIDPSYININAIASNNIAKYYIKGEWYFDRIMGEMRYRMLGICPVGKSASELEKNDDPYPLFWFGCPMLEKCFKTIEFTLEKIIPEELASIRFYSPENSKLLFTKKTMNIWIGQLVNT